MTGTPYSSERSARAKFLKAVPSLGKYLPLKCSLLLYSRTPKAPGRGGLACSLGREGACKQSWVWWCWQYSVLAWEGPRGCQSLNIYCVPKTVLCVHYCIKLVLILWTVWQRKSYYYHFMKKESEARQVKWFAQGHRAGIWWRFSLSLFF